MNRISESLWAHSSYLAVWHAPRYRMSWAYHTKISYRMAQGIRHVWIAVIVITVGESGSCAYVGSVLVACGGCWVCSRFGMVI